MKNKDDSVLASNAYVLLTSDYFPFSKTQCAVFKGTDRTVFLDKREYTGPIYKQIESAVDFVLRNIRLGATIDGLVRRESYELPLEAIREMIINAHCHRNLLDESCIQVAIYDDPLEVTSPGSLYNGLTDFGVNGGENFGDKNNVSKNGQKVTGTQQKILDCIAEDKYISAKKIAEKIGMSGRTVENNIKKMKASEILARHGSPKSGYWEIIE